MKFHNFKSFDIQYQSNAIALNVTKLTKRQRINHCFFYSTFSTKNHFYFGFELEHSVLKIGVTATSRKYRLYRIRNCHTTKRKFCYVLKPNIDTIILYLVNCSFKRERIFFCSSQDFIVLLLVLVVHKKKRIRENLKHHEYLG